MIQKTLEKKIENVDKNTTKNTVIPSNFLVQKVCGKAQFPQSFWRFTRKVNFKARIPEASKNLVTKNKIENILDLGDKPGF